MDLTELSPLRMRRNANRRNRQAIELPLELGNADGKKWHTMRIGELDDGLDVMSAVRIQHRIGNMIGVRQGVPAIGATGFGIGCYGVRAKLFDDGLLELLCHFLPVKWSIPRKRAASNRITPPL